MKPITENHPDEIRLLTYLESPKSEDVKDVRRHLITCASCRDALARAQALVDTIKLSPLPEKQVSGAGHPDEQIIADYVEGRISSIQKQQIKGHIDSCDACTKAVLHYAMHSAEMRREISEASVLKEAVMSEKLTKDDENEAPSPGPSPAGGEGAKIISPPLQGEGQGGDGLFSDKKKSLYRRIFSWRMPVWVGVPVTALAAFILVFIILNQTRRETGQQAHIAQQEKTKIVLAYQDNPKIIISPLKGKTPGIGFFSQSRGETKPFGGLAVQRISSARYRISWPAIDGVKLYDIRVYTPGERGMRSLVAAVKDLQ